MAFKNSTQKVMSKQLLKQVETKVDGRVILSDEIVVQKLLDCIANVKIVAEEKLGDYLQFSGEVDATIIFSNKEGLLNSEKNVLEFNEKINISDADGVCIIPEISTIKYNKESDSVVEVSIVVKNKIYGCAAEEFPVVIGEDDGFFIETKEIRMDTLVNSVCSQFAIQEQIQIADSSVKVLYEECMPNLFRVTPKDNYAIIEGCVNAEIATIQDGMYKKIKKSIDFSQEVPLLNLNEMMTLTVKLFNKGIKTEVRTSETDGKATIELDVTLGYVLWAYQNQTLIMLSDIFSENHEISTTISNINTKCINEQIHLNETQSIVFDMTNRKRMDEVVSVGNITTITDQLAIENNSVIASGVVSAAIIFKNYDSEEFSSIVLSKPFELKIATQFIEQNSYINGVIEAKCDSFKNKAGQEISINFDFDLQLFSQTSLLEQYISNIEVVGALENTNHSIIVYKPKHGQSVFDIAKELRVSPDVLRAQNPQIEDNKEIDKVVIYKQMD